MNIVFNTDQIHLHGGIEKVLTTKANYFANQDGTEVYIVTAEQQNKPPCYPLDSKIHLVDLGINYNRSTSYFSIENLRKAKQHFSRQKKLLKDLQPDILISPNYNFDHYWLPFIKRKTKLIKERHGSRFSETQQRKHSSLVQKLKFALNDYIDGKYDKIVVLTPDEKVYVQTDNAVVIPNPTEPTLLRADLLQKRVIAAGRISPVKAFDQLIEVWTLIHQDFPDWQLHFYGQDYLGTQQQLENLIEKYHLQDVIHFKGSVNNLTQIMTDYSIYAMTSETECFPMVLLESLSVGLPVISYDCPNGPRNILTKDEDSLLIPDKNIPIFTKKLKILMKNQNLRQKMGSKGIENVQRFSLDKVMAQWNNLFSELT